MNRDEWRKSQERKDLITRIKTSDAKLLQLEVTQKQRDILIDALSFYDQDEDFELDDRTFEDLRTQLDNAVFLGESA